MNKQLFTVVLATLALAGAARAQQNDVTPVPSQSPSGPEETTPNSESSDISGFKFGAGIAATFDFGGLERVASARVVNGIVRVEDEDDVAAGLAAEAHFFFEPSGTLLGVNSDDWGHGPFFAVQTGDEELFQTIALGWMIGLRPSGSSESFNLGLGIAVNPNVQTLGAGIVRDAPLPVGETEIRYREESQWGAILLFSRTF